ncbi:DUF6383 domain-containing protein [Parabacteroides hominis]|uniref:DUF6383 domain-containing protein n=1 Tax=Parabacteroides hominis TaxID=2763057 RepID=A0ABR7DME3_9BACT|nr:DUF6383 domain-containing protein [Parabacteroides hominis]MBC5632599.1 hypothetical protein [Parabacteroides hominis]
MNKKFTLLAAALMTVGTFTAASAAVDSDEWTAGNYYYLVSDNNYLSLDGNKADSVVVKEITSFENVDKAARDSALWEITGITETAGTVYQFKNKKTNAVLSFAASQEAKPILVAGVDKWTFTDGGSLSASIGDNKTMTLALGSDNGLVFKDGSALSLTVTKPDTMTMTPQDLGDGFSTFQLTFGDQYEGNIFTGEDLIANSIGDKGFMTLQVKGDEAYPNGVKKFLGVDTLKTTINNQENVFGAGFALDSTRKVLRPNERCQHFKFVVNLQNDSLAMFVAGAPDVNGDLELVDDTVRVVYAQTGSTKVLTVSELNADAQPLQGKLPLIKVSKGTPVTIPTGTGVYFLQKVSEGANNGKYYVTKNTFMGGDSVPSVNLARGQWYIKENNGKYSVVDRQSDSEMILNQEVFAVQGKENTYLFGNDSVKISWQPVNLNDKYLGSLYFTEDELNANGYVLNLVSGTTGVSNIYAYTTDSILKGKAGDAKDAAIFKLVVDKVEKVGGAKSLLDTLYVTSYKLRAMFNKDMLAKQTDSLKLSAVGTAESFRFISDATAEKYAMLTSDSLYVGMNVNTSCVQLSEKAAYVNLEAVDAPEYASFASAHKRLAYNNNALVMNPLNFFAEMKDEGNPITKANYEADNFSLWVEQDTVIAGKQLYFISSGVANGGKAEANIRYYLAAKDTTRAGIDATTYAMFISHDSIKTMKDSPALFAFKTAEEGGYYLENQKELDKNGKPYVGVVNGFAVMQATPSAAFEVQTASAPTANEEMNVSEIKVISNDGQVIVTNASGRMITLSNILGQTIGVRRASSEYFSMPATSGIVLVTVEGDTTYKVIVK